MSHSLDQNTIGVGWAGGNAHRKWVSASRLTYHMRLQIGGRGDGGGGTDGRRQDRYSAGGWRDLPSFDPHLADRNDRIR